MLKKVVFILAGRTDLRLVKDGKAWKFDKRAVHEALAAGERPWRMQEEATPIEDNWIGDIPPPPEALLLYPDKTLWLANSLKDIRALVVFNTCRHPDFKANGPSGREYGRNEPIALGPILAQWLGNKFGLTVATEANDIGFGKAGWINYLDGDMDLYEPGSRQLNRLGLARIERAMRLFAMPDAKAILFTGGGFPTIKEPAQEMARLLFDHRVELLHVPEGRTSVEQDQSPVTAEDSYKARQHATKHIRRGDFLAAYAAAAHLANDPNEAGWIKPLKATADFFAGEPVTESCAPPSLQRLMALEQEHYFIAAALRTEASLKSGRTVEGLLATFAFFDAAFIEAIRRYLGLRIDTLRVNPGNIAKAEKTDFVQGLVQNQRHLFDEEQGLRINNAGKAITEWCDRLAAQNPEYAPLQQMNGIFQEPDRSRNIRKIKDYRNQATHNRLSAEQARDVRTRLTESGIWDSRENECSPFLDRLLTRQIIAIHTDTDLAAAYRAVEAELVSTLRGHPIKP